MIWVVANDLSCVLNLSGFQVILLIASEFNPWEKVQCQKTSQVIVRHEKNNETKHVCLLLKTEGSVSLLPLMRFILSDS